MSIQTTLNGLIALSLLVASMLATASFSKASATVLSGSNHVLIAQSEETKPKPKPEGGGDDLGEDDC